MNTAKDIASAASDGGCTPVGIFVDETADEIQDKADQSKLAFVQLHGNKSRESILSLDHKLKVIYALQLDSSGGTSTPKPSELASESNLPNVKRSSKAATDWVAGGRRTVEYMLVDGQSPGSGEQACAFEAMRKPPRGGSRRGWLLAGGLGPENVGTAVETLRPDGVDVSSGVCASDGVSKDHLAMKSFIENVRRESALLS